MPNSLDMNPVDWCVECTGAAGVSHMHSWHDISHLKARLVEEWQKFDQKIIDCMGDQAVASTSEVMLREGEGHFEHQL